MPAETDWSTVNWNLFNPQADTTPSRTSWWVFDTLARFKQGQGEWEPMIAEDFSLDGNTVTINLRDDYMWHNGDPLTASDVVTQYRINRHLETQMWNFVEEVQAADEHTVELTVGDVNPEVIWPSFMDNLIFAKESIYGDFLDDLESSNGSDEAINALQSHQVNEPVGNGPFEVVSTSSDTLEYERFADYPRAENINWSGVEATFYPEETGMHQAALGNDLDAIDYRQFPPNIVEQLDDHWERVTVPAFEGNMIGFSPDGEFVGRDVEYSRPLRKAISYMFDAEQYVSLRPSSQTVDPQCGLCNTAINNYLGDVADDFEDYGPEPKIDQAEQVLEDAGFQKDDGQWYTPDDRAIELPFKFMGSWTSSHPTYENVAEQLSNFGFSSESIVVEDSQFFGPTLQDNDFEMALTGNWGQAGFAYPYFNLRPQLGTVGEPNFWTPGVETYEVPMPVGDTEGDLQEVNVNEKIRALSTSTDEDEAQTLVQELAWTVNQARPYMNPDEKRNQHFITRDEWSYPDSDSSLLQTNVPFIFLSKIGEMQAIE